jgi:hypothetical protein
MKRFAFIGVAATGLLLTGCIDSSSLQTVELAQRVQQPAPPIAEFVSSYDDTDPVLTLLLNI